MQQVLFNIPDPTGYFPNGLPIHGFGAMLFLAFITVMWFIGWRAVKTEAGVTREKMQDLTIFLFVAGLAGARITYMIQYRVPWYQFVQIWEGGIVLYGGIIAGILGFLFFHRFFLHKGGVSKWKLADVLGPALAIGIGLGRVGCFMNGCCYGHVAGGISPEVAFPLMTCPARETLVEKQGYQSLVGFTVKDSRASADLRSVIDRVEPGSQAETAGLKPGDRILRINGKPNGGVISVFGKSEHLDDIAKVFRENKYEFVDEVVSEGQRRIKAVSEDPKAFAEIRENVIKNTRVNFVTSDRFLDTIFHWPRGKKSLEFTVLRDGQEVQLPPFTPRTLGLHPTQLYETTSMFLLAFLLMSFFPYRRHDGQVFVLFVACYAVHRFLNEILRNDTPVEGFSMTLSQNISVLMLTFALGLELLLRYWFPRRTRQSPPTPSQIL